MWQLSRSGHLKPLLEILKRVQLIHATVWYIEIEQVKSLELDRESTTFMRPKTALALSNCCRAECASHAQRLQCRAVAYIDSCT